MISQSHSTCQMDFWYHMFGGYIGTLSVYILTGDRLTLLWKASGNKGIISLCLFLKNTKVNFYDHLTPNWSRFIISQMV